MGDQYTNTDLDTAETLLIAAGQPAIAQALRRYTEGQRNMLQGEWGQQSIAAMEGILGRLIDRQTETIATAVTAAVRQEVAAQLSPFRERLDRAENSIADLHHEILQGRLNKARREQLTSVVEEMEANLDLLRDMPGWKAREPS